MTLDQRPRALAQRYSLRDRLDRGTGDEIWRAQDDVLGRDGRVRLAGFGRPNGSGATPDGDVRAVAALLFEALTGSPPPPGAASPSTRAFRAGIPRELDDAIRRVLASSGEGTPDAEK